MLATLLLVSSSMVGQGSDSLPRVARTIAASTGSPVMITAWQSNGAVKANVTALASIPTSPGSPSGTTIPQATLTTSNGTFTASSPLSPDPDIDEANNTVVAWVARPPYDPNATPAPTGNEVYLSYNAGAPIRVSTDLLSSTSTAYGTFAYSSQYASIARVTMSRDGTRIAVGWSSGGDNLSANAVNASAVFVRTYTVASPGPNATIWPDASVPTLVTPYAVSGGTGGYPGYPGGGGGSGPRFTINTGPYHFGDIASDKSDGSNSGYVVLSYVRQVSWNGSYQGISQTRPDGIFVKGYDWGLNPTFPTTSDEQAMSPGTGSAYYSYTELDASHEGTHGAGWFVLGYNVSSTLYVGRFDASGNVLVSPTATASSLPSSSMGWGFSVGARTNTGGVAYLVTQETHIPDSVGIGIVHQAIVNDAFPLVSTVDVVGPSYADGSKRWTNPNAVLYDDATTVGIAYDGYGAILLLRH